eukprot:TRINITY_DN74622_c0_g1_i1.p1 TRINITY_DN74622_c0_g1~~TRINITY_DN74622_c0_g1_i1.p1  ORF type:complete len:584 (-),score=96.79 TRINITY_DN74622_c0_g1_i1:444-2144(-)
MADGSTGWCLSNCGGGYGVCGGPIAVVYDATSPACVKSLRMIRARETSLPPAATPTVKLVPWPSETADEILQSVAVQLRQMNLGADYGVKGRMFAVLPSRLAIPDCHEDVIQLIAEMENMALVQPPTVEMTTRINVHCDRIKFHHGEPGQWWRSASAMLMIADALQDLSFCILDDFLRPTDADMLEGQLRATKPAGTVPVEGKCGWTRGGTGRAAEALANDDAEARNESVARSLLGHTRGDVVRYSDDDSTVPGTCALCQAVDELVMGLRTCAKVTDRLSHVDFANSVMYSVYPSGGARYVKHTDNALMTDGRRLTTILYLNKHWEPAHGGCLRLFEPPMQNTRVKIDVEPRWNRLLVFWSTDEVPHEVLASFHDRLAASIWYICGRESLQTEDSFKRLVTKVRCIGQQDPVERLATAGQTAEQRQLLRRLAVSRSSGRGGTGDDGDAAGTAGEEELLAAIQHDFTGCERYRRQRERMNRMFGWDERAASVHREVLQSQLEQVELFKRMGLPVPPGIPAPPPPRPPPHVVASTVTGAHTASISSVLDVTAVDRTIHRLLESYEAAD